MTKNTKRTASNTAPMTVNASKPKTAKAAAVARAFATIERAIERDVSKANKEEAARNKAIADTMPALLAELDGEALSNLFFLLETCATVSNARKIATHPLRSPQVDELLAEAKAEEQDEAIASGADETDALDDLNAN